MKPGVPRGTWLALALLAALLRLLAWSHAEQMANDGPDFLWQARRLLEGDVGTAVSHPYHPLLATLTAAVAAPVGWLRPAETVFDLPVSPEARRLSCPRDEDLARAAVAVTIAAGVACVLAAMALARRIAPDEPRAALGAGLIVAVHSRAVVHGSDIQGDTLAAALACWAVVALVDARDPARALRRGLLAGLLTGLAYLARPEALALGAVALLSVAAPWHRGARRAALASFGSFVAGAAVCVLPYAATISELSGQPVLSLKPSARTAGAAPPAGRVLLPEGAPMASPLVRRPPGPPDRETDRETGAVRGQQPPQPAPDRPEHAPTLPAPPPPDRAETAAWQPLSAAGTALRRLADTLRADVALAALVGLFLLRRPVAPAASLALATVAVWLLLFTWHLQGHSYLSQRHVLVPAILLLSLTGVAMTRLLLATRSRRTRIWLGTALALMLLLHLASGQRVRHGDARARLEALGWARANSAPGETLVVARLKDGWYARRPVIVVEWPGRREDLLATMDREGAELVVLDAARLARPAADWTGDGSFTEVHRVEHRDQAAIVLRRVR